MARKVTEEVLQDLEVVPYYAWGEGLDQLLFWEAFGFGKWTIKELVDFLIDYIETKRKFLKVKEAAV